MVISQFIAAIIGVFYGILAVRQYSVDLAYAISAGDVPRQFVAKSNIRRECWVLFAQALLLFVGATYYVYPMVEGQRFDIVQIRQMCLLTITGALAAKVIGVRFDRKRLLILLSK